MGLVMAALFSADQNGFLASIRYNMLCKKVARAKMFVNLNYSHQPPPPVNFIPGGLTSRLWSGWDAAMKCSHLSGDGRQKKANLFQ